MEGTEQCVYCICYRSSERPLSTLGKLTFQLSHPITKYRHSGRLGMRVVNHERVNLYSGALIYNNHSNLSHYSTETAAATSETEHAKNAAVKKEEEAATSETKPAKKRKSSNNGS